ncbi:MAG: bifunctional metallophosphatase/5'-nucleotidase, partial [Clostridium sp.]
MVIKKLLKRSTALAVSSMMLTMLIQPLGVQASTTDKVLKIFHSNDTHSRVDNFPIAKTYINSARADGKLLLDAGDTYHGQSFATLQRGSSIAQLIKKMGYEAMSPGNHDFNYGHKRLSELEKESGVPILAANLTKDGNLAYKDGMIITKNGVDFGVFGLATPETTYKTNPINVEGLDFGSKETVIKNSQDMVTKLEAQGADIVIALSHLGIDDESELKSTDIATNVEGIDLIIDGHSHSKLSDFDEHNKNNKTKITSTGQYMDAIGEATITVDSSNKVKDISLNTVALTKTVDKVTTPLYTPDPEIKSLIDGIKAGQDPILNEVVGFTPVTLDGARSTVRFGHSNLGRLLTDAMISETGADVALTNGGGIRDSINAGEITKGEIIKVLPFGNYTITKKLTGAEIIAALNHGMIIGSGSFTHYSGIDAKTTIITEEFEG